ncbi:hypothetical protein MWU75_15360 [Ornithinimicrobium sp. F0845]|uniref:hypothetical protein n=1 Tax=Ornithinimicrobium sp. F0845 TaxID=2926412 RepID=UPI001FF1C7A0|nr:hypothetical protein [Ornithinimicrobium sp. F0845]MCK0113525.1 hypothetical protein [Ornithinimicrobium sp. F0845]
MSVTSVSELQRAWHAVQEGQFRHRPGARPRTTGTSTPGDSEPGPLWRLHAPVLPVIGCHGAAGASTIAAAVASTFAGPTHLVEACGPGTSGLVAYATAELGETGSGWLRGSRDHAVVDRIVGGALTPAETPLPDAVDAAVLHVLDPGWDTQTLALSSGWLREAVLDADRLVLVTTATVPGMRRLEGALLHLDPARQLLAIAVRGPKARRWAREVQHCLGPHARTVLDQALVVVPDDPGLHVRGLDTEPLPRGVLAAATQIVQLTGLAAGTNNQKGTTHARQQRQ